VILDTSAIISILVEEPDSEQLLEKLGGTEAIGVGAPTLVETAIVLSSRLGPRSRDILDNFLQELEASIVPFSEAHWRVAAEAHQRFGKGRHPAALNFGDCLSYAAAALASQPLLCLGNDFSQTDLDLA
jgi:ribonuclease VapC